MDRKQRIIEIIAEQLGVELKAVKPETSLLSLGTDRLDTTEIAMALEEEFNIEEIIDEEVIKFKTVGDIILNVESKINASL